MELKKKVDEKIIGGKIDMNIGKLGKKKLKWRKEKDMDRILIRR